MATKAEQKREAAIIVIKQAADKWKSSFIPRTQVPEFTGGLIAAGTLANLDSAKKNGGIPGAFRIGRQVCYPVDSLCDWLISRLGV